MDPASVVHLDPVRRLAASRAPELDLQLASTSKKIATQNNFRIVPASLEEGEQWRGNTVKLLLLFQIKLKELKTLIKF